MTQRRDRENLCKCGKRFFGVRTACSDCLERISAKKDRDRLSIAKGKELYAKRVESIAKLRSAVGKYHD